jgi:hypothetical protein
MHEIEEGTSPIRRARPGERMSIRNNLRAGSPETLVRTPDDHPWLDRLGA